MKYNDLAMNSNGVCRYRQRSNSQTFQGVNGMKTKMSFVLTSLLIFAFACGDDDGNSNGNVYNDSGANCTSCKKWEICSGGKCTFNNASRWNLTADGAVVNQKDANGNAWDTLGGLPDPMVCVTINGAKKCTYSKQDTLTPAWYTTLHNQVGAGTLIGGFSITILDDDLTTPDIICQGNVTIQESWFSQGIFAYDCANAKIQFSITYAD